MRLMNTRLSLYAIIISIEEDLRILINTYLGMSMMPKDILGNVYEKCISRFKKDTEYTEDQATITQLLSYVDFPDGYEILNIHSSKLPNNISKHIKEITPKLSRLVSIRNRVMHNRPLQFDDLSITIDTARRLVSLDDITWSNVSITLMKLDNDPTFIFDLRIETYEEDISSQKHNLPTPDFDETGFLGRKELLKSLIQQCYGPYPVITIVGEGGVGKTALALKAAYEILDNPDNPFDAIVWTTSKTSMLTPQEIIRIDGAISDSLGMFYSISKHLAGVNVQDPLEEVINYLKEFHILLVIDNLETILDERIRSFFGQLPTGSKVLVTSRIGIGAYEYPIRLQPLEADEAVQLLRTLAVIRGVPDLVKVSNKVLISYCNRMNNNPGYIKWFVSAVQSGCRAEDILIKPDIFLDYCMTNVYEYLDLKSRDVFNSMIVKPGRHSQAELAFMNDFNEDDIKKALIQLGTTNMISIISVPSGLSYETYYESTELSRSFVLKHHPIKTEQRLQITKRSRQLVSISEEVMADRNTDPYNIYAIHIRNKSDIIVAKYLKDILQYDKKHDYQNADALLNRVRELSPGYFEVYRVSGWVRAGQGNLSVAQEDYEIAIGIEPDSAPLRYWYAGFLMRFMNDLDGALEHIEIAEKIDSSSNSIKLEMARLLLYKRNFDQARSIVDNLLGVSDLTRWSLRKVFDLHLQIYARQAEHFCLQHDEVSAITYLEELKRAYENCPNDVIDRQIREKVIKAIPTAHNCMNYARDEKTKVKANIIIEWLKEIEAAGWLYR